MALQAHWSKWREDARFWYGFVAGDQWTDEEKSRMEDAEKIAVTFNLIGPVVDAVQGAEIGNRQQAQYYPRTVGDTGISDVLTQGADYVNEGCNGDQEDSEAIWDVLVCGLGWTETRPEVEGDELDLIKERVDPLQMLADPSARKRCLEDMRYLKREIPMSDDEFDAFKVEIGRPDIEGEDGQRLGDGKRLTVVNPRQRYTHGPLGAGDEGQGDVTLVCEWQWWDYTPVILAPAPSASDPNVVALKQHTPDEFAALQQQHVQAGLPPPKSSKSRKKVFYRAFVGLGEILFREQLKEGDFRYKCITGKRGPQRRDVVRLGEADGRSGPLREQALFGSPAHRQDQCERRHGLGRGCRRGRAQIREHVGRHRQDHVAEVRQFEWAARRQDAAEDPAAGADGAVRPDEFRQGHGEVHHRGE